MSSRTDALDDLPVPVRRVAGFSGAWVQLLRRERAQARLVATPPGGDPNKGYGASPEKKTTFRVRKEPATSRARTLRSKPAGPDALCSAFRLYQLDSPELRSRNRAWFLDEFRPRRCCGHLVAEFQSICAGEQHRVNQASHTYKLENVSVTGRCARPPQFKLTRFPAPHRKLTAF